ncbi:hypothetical protein [Fundidesulfovibrio agrisoli]|uniref:hypothetical protein n=1 Tax=Fundidesulfovibrio agrisoli TaxID=2922717 RepID=UPI001FABA251|nr:hypothetical protein [Fundidesulfovibrio agrisoli]
MNYPESSPSPGAPPLPERWRVGDGRFARAYARTGDSGRAVIKTCIAGAYETADPQAPARTLTAGTFPSGNTRLIEKRPRPWFALVLGQAVQAPAQVVAAVLPAMARRIPLVAVLRPGVSAPWPDAVLAALELCGVENVFSPPLKELPGCLEALSALGPGGVACLGDFALWSRVRDAGEISHWLRPSASMVVLDSGAQWDMEAVAVAHAGVPLTRLNSWDEAAPGSLDAALAYPGQAPDWCPLVLEPGREAMWDWPGLPEALFHQTRVQLGRG